MISLSDAQVIRTACDLAPEKRDDYLQRIASCWQCVGVVTLAITT